jgi:hypothetical protein
VPQNDGALIVSKASAGHTDSAGLGEIPVVQPLRVLVTASGALAADISDS